MSTLEGFARKLASTVAGYFNEDPMAFEDTKFQSTTLYDLVRRGDIEPYRIGLWAVEFLEHKLMKIHEPHDDDWNVLALFNDLLTEMRWVGRSQEFLTIVGEEITAVFTQYVEQP